MVRNLLLVAVLLAGAVSCQRAARETLDLTRADAVVQTVVESTLWDPSVHHHPVDRRTAIDLVGPWSELDSDAEGAGSWATAPEVKLRFTVVEPRERRLELVLSPGPSAAGQQQSITVLAGARALDPGPIELTPATRRVEITVPAWALPKGHPELTLRFAFALSPQAVDPSSADTRTLAARLHRIHLKLRDTPRGQRDPTEAATAELDAGAWLLRAPAAVRFPLELPAGSRVEAVLESDDGEGLAAAGVTVERDGSPPWKPAPSAQPAQTAQTAQTEGTRSLTFSARVPAGGEPGSILEVRAPGPPGATVRVTKLLVHRPVLSSGDSSVHAVLPPAPPKRIVLVIIDAASALHASAYGYARPTSPFLAQLAREGVRFERAYAPASYTIASIAAILTGLYPERNGVFARRTRLHPKVPTLAGGLHRLGMRTCVITANPNASETFGGTREFDEVVDVFRDHSTVMDPEVPRPRMLIPETLNELALGFLNRDPADPAFVYLHQVPPHHPYLAPPPFRGIFASGERRELIATWRAISPRLTGTLEPWEQSFARDRYDENFRYADDGLERLVGRLSDAGLLDDTLLVVTSDHGEGFGEHGMMLHSSTVYEEVVRVPLIVKPPASWHVPPHVVRTPVTTVDLLPTLLALAQGATAEAAMPEGYLVDGIDLSGSILGTREPPARLLTARSNETWDRQAVIDGRWKYIDDGHDGHVELYDLAADPAEWRELSATQPVRAERLAIQLARILELRQAERVDAAPAKLDDASIESLRALGYAGE